MSSKLKNKIPKLLLAVGGVDPSGHAGLLADVRVFERLRVPYRIAITAVTAQSEKKFYQWETIRLDLFRAQLRAARGPLFGVKLGMLGTLELGRELLRWLKKNPRAKFLWDPVLRSSSGTSLLLASGWNSRLTRLLERTDVLTPNLPEAEWILGETIATPEQTETAVKKLYRMGKRPGRLVVLKGGHFLKKASGDGVVDWVYDGKKLLRLQARRRPERRGTGCTFGAALLAALARGQAPMEAARFAKRYVLSRLLDAPAL